MTDLPTAAKISTLTDDNLQLVAKTYLSQIIGGACKDVQVAATFINTALQHRINALRLWQSECYRNIELVDRTLRFVPHVSTSKLRNVPEDKILDWLRRNGIHEFDHFPHGLEEVYVFKTWDAAVLFKLRWA